MYEFWHTLFRDYPGGNFWEIKLFNLWHFLYIVLIIGVTVLIALKGSGRRDSGKRTVWLNAIAGILVTTYLLDFMIQPFMTDSFSMNIDKLPFHICIVMCPLIVLVQFCKKANWLKMPVTVFSLVASLMYITYPGSALGGITFYSYRVVQTFFYHGLLFAYGFLNLAWDVVELKWSRIWHCAVVLVCLELWAGLGNFSYNHGDEHFDWLFITGSTYPFIPKPLMPVVVFVAIMGMVAIIYALYFLFRRLLNRNKPTDAAPAEAK